MWVCVLQTECCLTIELSGLPCFVKFSSEITHLDHCFSFHPTPSLYPPNSLFPSPVLFCLLSKKAGLPWLPTKHGITCCNKIKHITSYLDRIRQHFRKKRAQQVGKKSETICFPTVRNPTRVQNYLAVTYA